VREDPRSSRPAEIKIGSNMQLDEIDMPVGVDF